MSNNTEMHPLAGNVAAATAAPAKSKAQIRDEFLRSQRAAKAEAAKAKKAETAAKRADGVIGTIRTLLDRPEGVTKTEALAVLTAKFANRDPMGMVVTVGIQFSRLAQSTGRKIENYKAEPRGRVYGFADKLVRPAVSAEMPATPTAPAAPAATPAPVEVTEAPKAQVVRRPQGQKVAVK